MQPAISTLVVYKNRFGNLVKILEENFRIQNWEIIDEGFHGLDEKKIVRLRDLASTQNLKYAVHAPFSSINLAEANPTLRGRFVEFMKESLEKTYKLEASIWVVHPGRLTPFTLFFPEEAWKAQIDALKSLVKEANKVGVKVVVENMIGVYSVFKTVEDGIKILENVEDIGICLDVGHANVTGVLEEFIKKVPAVQHIHVHDNHGVEDEHLAAGDGTIDWDWFVEQLKKIKYRGWIVAENYELKDSIKTLERLKLV